MVSRCLDCHSCARRLLCRTGASNPVPQDRDEPAGRCRHAVVSIQASGCLLGRRIELNRRERGRKKAGGANLRRQPLTFPGMGRHSLKRSHNLHQKREKSNFPPEKESRRSEDRRQADWPRKEDAVGTVLAQRAERATPDQKGGDYTIAQDCAKIKSLRR
jgi:hypothetical protein